MSEFGGVAVAAVPPPNEPGLDRLLSHVGVGRFILPTTTIRQEEVDMNVTTDACDDEDDDETFRSEDCSDEDSDSDSDSDDEEEAAADEREEESSCIKSYRCRGLFHDLKKTQKAKVSNILRQGIKELFAAIFVDEKNCEPEVLYSMHVDMISS